MTHKLTAKFIPNSKTILVNKLADEKLITTTWVLSERILYSTVTDLIQECHENGLIANHDLPLHIKVSGPSVNFDKFLGTDLHNFICSGGTCVHYAPKSSIKIPLKWKDDIVNILGLDTYPIAKPYVQFVDGELAPRNISAFTPIQLANLYNFPENLDGSGQKIGIIQLDGGYVMSDVTTYFLQLGINVVPNIIDVSVDGGKNNPYGPYTANTEVILDLEVIIAIVPKAEIRIYFAPNTFQGFYNAINKGINDNCNIISISWGASESHWTPTAMASYNNLFQTAANKNITILAAAGDNGSSDGTASNNVDFPGSSPFILSCGGTRVIANQNIISEETVWNVNPTTSATGGGISAIFDKPSYQNSITFNLNGKRGVPDVSGNADPNTGYILWMNGKQLVIGGTSAVSPLWSGLLARINQSIGKNVGFIHQTLYSNPSVCRDILQGNNGAFSASVGWDACSGNGSPNGTSLLNLYQNPAPIIAFSGTLTNGTKPLTVTFTNQSANNPTTQTWDFGDGSTASIIANPTHTYANSGTYDITLTANNDFGSTTLTKNKYITVTDTNLLALFTTDKIVAKYGSSIKFTDISSNASITSWLWNFGDGSIGTGSSVYHRYGRKGTFTVKLTVSDGTITNTLTKQKYITIK